MSDQTDLARGWLRKACSDLAAARRILSGEGPYDLARLCQQLEPIPELRLQELAEATDYAVQIRYDLEIWPSQQEARQALALAEQLCALILRHLPPEVHP